MKKISFVVVFLSGIVFCNNFLAAQATGDYRTIASGNWDSVSIWQQFNNAQWNGATTPPTETANVITIRAGHTVVTDRNRTADQVIVAAGGTLHLSVFSLSSTFLLHNGAGTDLLCNGRLVVDGNALLGDDTTTGGSKIEYTADTLVHSGGIGPAFTFDGAVHQVITGSGYMGQLVLNNPANLEITGTTSFHGVYFLNGKINVTGMGNLVVSQYSDPFVGQSNTRFIDGRVVCIIYSKNSPFPFSIPMGKGNEYLPIDFTVTQDADLQTNFEFTITNGAPSNRALPSTLQNVSSARYYTISKFGDANVTNAQVKFSYNNRDDVSDPTHLRIAKSNGSQWVDVGGSASGSPNGTVFSTVNFITFSDFVLANAVNGGNTLPLNITAFRLTQQAASVSLFWKAENESNIAYYEVQRKDLDNNWKAIATVKVNSSGDYSFTDDVYKSSGTYEYQIRQVNKDNQAYYSKQLSASIQNRVEKLALAQLFPNPAAHLLNYLVVSPKDDLLTVNITDIRGGLIKSQQAKANEFATIFINNLKSGSYLLIIYNKTTGEKIVKEFIKK